MPEVFVCGGYRERLTVSFLKKQSEKPRIISWVVVLYYLGSSPLMLSMVCRGILVSLRFPLICHTGTAMLLFRATLFDPHRMVLWDGFHAIRRTCKKFLVVRHIVRSTGTQNECIIRTGGSVTAAADGADVTSSKRIILEGAIGFPSWSL